MPLLEAAGVKKVFGKLTALDGASLAALALTLSLSACDDDADSNEDTSGEEDGHEEEEPVIVPSFTVLAGSWKSARK